MLYREEIKQPRELVCKSCNNRIIYDLTDITFMVNKNKRIFFVNCKSCSKTNRLLFNSLNQQERKFVINHSSKRK